MIRTLSLSAIAATLLQAADTTPDPLADDDDQTPVVSNQSGPSDEAVGDDERLDPFALPDPPAGQASEEAPPTRLTFDGRLHLGYDTNVTLESDALDLPSDQESAFVALAASLKYRRRLANGWRLGGQGFLEHHTYTDIDDRDLTQFGLVGSLVGGGERLLHSGVAGYNLVALDGEAEAHALNGGYRMSLISDPRRIWFGAADLVWVNYPDLDEASGLRFDLRGGVWLLLDPDIDRRRLETDLRLSSYRADADDESYTSARARLRGRWRWPGKQRPLEVDAGLTMEYREYDEGRGGDSAESRLITRAETTADWWWHPQVATGGFVRGTISASDRDANDYERLIIGASLTARW